MMQNDLLDDPLEKSATKTTGLVEKCDNVFKSSEKGNRGDCCLVNYCLVFGGRTLGTRDVLGLKCGCACLFMIASITDAPFSAPPLCIGVLLSGVLSKMLMIYMFCNLLRKKSAKASCF